MPAPPPYQIRPRPSLGLGAVLALVAAVGSLLSSCSGHPFWGLILSLLSLPLGALGMLQAVSPRIRGGFYGFLAIILGVVGLVIAILGVAFGILLFPFR